MRRKKEFTNTGCAGFFPLHRCCLFQYQRRRPRRQLDAADNEQEAHTPNAADTSDTPYEKGTITDTDFQSEWLKLKFTPPEQQS